MAGGSTPTAPYSPEGIVSPQLEFKHNNPTHKFSAEIRQVAQFSSVKFNEMYW
jgi:hypothetical protein